MPLTASQPAIPALLTLLKSLTTLPASPTTADLAAISLAAGQVGPLVATASTAMPILTSKGYDTAFTNAANQLSTDAAAATPASYASVSNDVPLVKLAALRFIGAAYAQGIANEIAAGGCASVVPADVISFQTIINLLNATNVSPSGQYDADTAAAASTLIDTNAAGACTSTTTTSPLPIVTLPVTTQPAPPVTPVSTTSTSTTSTTSGIPTAVYVGGVAIGVGALVLLAMKMNEAKTVAAATVVARKRR